MYTRPRSNPSYPNVRNPIAPNVGYTGQSAYPQGSFPPPQSGPNQPVNYKPGVSQNSPLRAPQHTSAQIMQPRSMPLHVKSQPSQNVQQPNMQQQNKQQQNIQQQQQSIQQQQQQSIQQQQQNIQQQQQKLQQLPQQQQQQQQPQQLPQQIKQQLPATNSPQTPKLKPILKPSLQSPQQPLPSTQNNPTTNQPSIPIPQPVPAPTPAPTSAPAPVPPPTTEGAIVTNNPSDTTNTSETSESMDIETLDQPKWRRKVAGAKTTAANRVNKRLKRLRLNQRLRKTLQPKNAIMVLNEMKAGVQFTFPATQGSMPNSLHVVHAEVGGKTYVGQGLSRSLARQSAAENALKALLLEKMTAVTMKFHLDNATDSQLGNGGSYKRKRETKDTATETNNVVGDDANEIPWSSLASFALYKLFLEWHNQGISVPVSRPGLPTTVKNFKPEPYRTQKPSTQKELPPNATSIHPVMLLNQMRPGLVYVEKSRTGNPPNTMFTLAVKIDDIEYTGTAKNKKDAKKVAAKSALLALYDLIYPDDTKPILREQVHSPEAQMA